ncbi:hypothetical protein H0H92_012361 [Tricholoma furcatifolium]|nr:hypothetical protein H0H92_012361 [Tricholoma furcatifolium]
MEMLIISRFLSGIGGGGLLTVGSIIVSDMYSMRNRGLAQGMTSVFNGLGMGLGGPVGGLVNDWLGWRWAFLIQLPVFLLSFALTFHFHHYVTPGKGRSTKEILKRIDYGGSIVLLFTVGALLVLLSSRYNEGLPWSDPTVIASIVVASVGLIVFLLVELYIAEEPVLAPSLLKQKIPVLVGCSNFLVAMCNFSVNYFYPMWFQTVMSTSAATAGKYSSSPSVPKNKRFDITIGLHLVPNSLSIALGSVFAGYMMHRTGKYKTINLTFGWFPFIGASLVASLNRDSPPLLTWMGIAPLGFGNAVVLQTMLIALLVNLPESQMAVGTGFGQLFRGIGQVGGVAVSSAIFQSKLDTELRRRITGPDAEEIPDRNLDDRVKGTGDESDNTTPSASGYATPREPQAVGDGRTALSEGPEPDSEHGLPPKRQKRRRLSTYESADGGMDPEGDELARTRTKTRGAADSKRVVA